MNCPICKQDNQCGAEAQSTEDCWCKKEFFPKELLDQVSKKQPGESCICKSCLDKWKQQ